MLAETIEEQIRVRATQMTTTHVAMRRAREGRVDSGCVANYLASLQFLFSQTIPHLRRAKTRATDLGLEQLVPFFEKKIAEELGHEKWAANDLDVLSRERGIAKARPLPAVVQLTEYVANLIEADPRLYVVYGLCAEYFTVLAGPLWVGALTESCSIPNAALTAVTRHVEADRVHAVHALARIDELITDPALAPVAAGTVDRTMQLFDQFFQEVVTAVT